MIENPEPSNWKDLQAGVCRIFNEIGLKAEQDKEIKTPRGTLSLDVFAIDPGSADCIQYIVECKNWKSSVPQSVVHSFTTVMQEVGANIGYIFSQQGFQKGATKYLRNTNIKGTTYRDFQTHYLGIWIDRHFCPTVRNAADSLIQYTEPINTRRERHESKLSSGLQNEFISLHKKYNLFGMALAMISVSPLMPQRIPRPDISPGKMNRIIAETIGKENRIERHYLGEYLKKLVQLIEVITEKFIKIFGADIFAQQNA
jgi:restriction system protein